jgi:hypothetical protein
MTGEDAISGKRFQRMLARPVPTMRDWMGRGKKKKKKGILHASRATCPIAVVKVEAFALENEGAEAILYVRSVSAIEKEDTTQIERTHPTGCHGLDTLNRHHCSYRWRQLEVLSKPRAEHGTSKVE